MLSVTLSVRAVGGVRRAAGTMAENCLSCAQRSYMSTQPLSSPEEEPQMMLILGKPGGGKGTISGKLLNDFPRFHHVSTGDLLRQHVREQTALGRKAKSYMDDGKLVPDELMIELVMDDAAPFVEEGNSLLLDGFPRNLDQAKALDQVARIGIVVNLDVPTEVIVNRIADR
jgi:adenylate kinase family enzyme